MADHKLGTALKSLLKEEGPRGTVRLHLEPVLKGYPFPESAGGPKAKADAEPVRYDGALYVYDDAILKRLIEANLIRSIKSGLTEGKDFDGKSCKKVYLKTDVLQQYFELEKGARKAFEEKAGYELLALNPSSEVAMAVAKLEPSADIAKEHDHALVMRVLDRTPPALGYRILTEAGLITHSDGHIRIPHYIEYDQDKGIYTYVVPITEPVAQAILRCESNKCVNWIDAEPAKRMGLDGHETMEMLAEHAVTAPEMQGIYSTRKPPQDRATAAAAADAGKDRTAAGVQPAIAPVEASALPPLSSFREELIGLLRSDSIHRTTQPMLNGGVAQVLRIKGDDNQSVLRRLLKDSRKATVRDPLVAGLLRMQREADTNYYYFSTSDGEIKRLAQVMGVADFPSCKPLPIQLPKDPFRAHYAGDYGRPMGISRVFLHQQGGEHVMYVASDSAVRLKLLAEQFGLGKENPNRSWITNEDETPSIMRLVIPAEAFEALKQEKIRSAEGRRRGETAPPDKLPDVLDAGKSKEDVESLIRAQFNIKDRSKPAPAQEKAPTEKAPEIGPEEGIPELIKLLEQKLAEDMPDAKAGSNLPTNKYRASLTKVMRKETVRDGDTVSYQPVAKSVLVIRGKNSDLGHMIGALRQLGWPDSKSIVREKGPKDPDLAGLITITLPDVAPNDAWSQIRDRFMNIETINPKRVGKEGAEDHPSAFKNAADMRAGMKEYFDSLQRFGKYISPEDRALANLKGKAIRVMTIDAPDEARLAAIDRQIDSIKASIAVLKDTVQALDGHAEAVTQKADKGKRKPKGKDKARSHADRIHDMDELGGILKRAADGAKRETAAQQAQVRRLEGSVRDLRARAERIHEEGMHQEIVVFDPDHETESLLNNAPEIVVGKAIHAGKALRFTPAQGLMETLRERGISHIRLGKTVKAGDETVSIGRAMKKWQGETSGKADDQPDSSEQAAPQKPTIKRRTIERVIKPSSLLQPILVYEKASDQSDARPILILPLRNHEEGDQAANLCRKMSEAGMLELTQWHWLQDTLEGRRAAQPQAASIRKPHRPAAVVSVTEFEDQVTSLVDELVFHARKIMLAESGDVTFHQTQFSSLLGDLCAELAEAEDQKSGKVESSGQREVLRLFNNNGLRKELDTLVSKPQEMDKAQAGRVYKGLKDVVEGIKAMQRERAEITATDHADTVTVIGRRQPYPLDAEVMPDHDPFVYSDALGQMARDMAGKAHKTPALKVYLSDMGATAFTEWAQQCKVDVVPKSERVYAPHELMDFAAQRLSEEGHRIQQEVGRGRGSR